MPVKLFRRPCCKPCEIRVAQVIRELCQRIFNTAGTMSKFGGSIFFFFLEILPPAESAALAVPRAAEGAAVGARHGQVSWQARHLKHVIVKFRGRPCAKETTKNGSKPEFIEKPKPRINGSSRFWVVPNCFWENTNLWWPPFGTNRVHPCHTKRLGSKTLPWRLQGICVQHLFAHLFCNMYGQYLPHMPLHLFSDTRKVYRIRLYLRTALRTGTASFF